MWYVVNQIVATVAHTKMADDAELEQWKLKTLVKRLDGATGNGTSMISLLIPPKDQVGRIQKLLTEEYGAAANIKSRVNRLSVLSAITSAQQRLKLYRAIPPNGLALYCGTITTDDGKDKGVTIDFEPFKPLTSFTYLCHSRFNTEPLAALLQATDTYGFIVVDGHGCTFATVCGNHRTILQRFDVDLPRKHGRGGQSSARFGRIRMEKRQAYLTKVAEAARTHFVSGERVTVRGLVLAGSAEFKNALSGAAALDPRLQAAVIAVVDVAYGGESGLNQALDLAGPVLQGVRLVQERRALQDLFERVAKDTGDACALYCFGVADTMAALEMGAVDTLMLWEDLAVERYTYSDAAGQETVGHGTAPCPPEGAQLTDTLPLVEYLVEHHRASNAALQLVSDRSAEGAQFCQAFGGIGATLRYAVDLCGMAAAGGDDDADFLDDFEEFM